MLQNTRYTERQDGLPPLRLRGYHTYHQPYVSHGNGDVECHGLLTMVYDRVPSKCAQQQLRIGDGTESLSVRVWLNNKSILLHNIYRVDGEFDVVTPLSDGEESIMAGDFNARHTSWCRANNAAGSSLNDQLVQLDTHILMNTPHVSTTVHDTVIDLSLVSNEMAANTYWSIYPGFVSDHLAVMLTIVNTRLPDSTPRPKDGYWNWPTGTSTKMSCKKDQLKWNGMVILRSTSNSWSQLYSRRLKSLFLRVLVLHPIAHIGETTTEFYWLDALTTWH